MGTRPPLYSGALRLSWQLSENPEPESFQLPEAELMQEPWETVVVHAHPQGPQGGARLRPPWGEDELVGGPVTLEQLRERALPRLKSLEEDTQVRHLRTAFVTAGRVENPQFYRRFHI